MSHRSVHLVLLLFAAVAGVLAVLLAAAQPTTAQVVPPSPVTAEMLRTADAISAYMLQSPERNSEVYTRLAQLVDDYGSRFSGSDSLEAALDWIVATAAAEGPNSGYTVSTEPVMVPRWVRGQESAYLSTPTQQNQRLAFVSYGMCNGTGGVPITAPVLVVKNADELTRRCSEAKGKIVVWNWFTEWPGYRSSIRYTSPGAVAACGGVASLIRTLSSFGMQTPHTGGTSTGAIPTGALSLADTDQIQRQFDRGVPMNITLSLEAHFLPDRQSRNIIMDVRGSSKPDEFIVLAGHSDSWDGGSKGAMDDGGGIVSAWIAVKCLAELQKQGKIPPLQRTVRAFLSVNEENGNRGGEAYARINAGAVLDKTSIAIESDEGSFEPWGIGFSGSDAAYAQLKTIADSNAFAAFGKAAITVQRGGGGEDISPMCQAGVPCAGVLVLDPRATNASNNPCQGFQLAADYDPAYVTAQAVRGISSGYFWYHHSVASSSVNVCSSRSLLSTVHEAALQEALPITPKSKGNIATDNVLRCFGIPCRGRRRRHRRTAGRLRLARSASAVCERLYERDAAVLVDGQRPLCVVGN